MPALSDLNTALDGLTADVAALSTLSTEIATELAALNAGTVPQATMDKVTALKTGLDAIVAAESADVPPS